MEGFLSNSRYLGVIIIVTMVIGAVIMIGIGAYHTYEAAITLFGYGHPPEGVSNSLFAKIELLESLDSFLAAIAMLYFACGTYFLVLKVDPDDGAAKFPEWLRVKNLGVMKKTLLEVIVVLLAVVFLQDALNPGDYDPWLLLIYPASILAIAAAIKLIPFDH